MTTQEYLTKKILLSRNLETTPVHHLHRGDPDTSVEAAESIDPTRLELMVLGAIRRLGPCISDEVREQFPGAAYSSITARYRALLDKGMIRDTGQRRPGKSGRGQRVMVAT